ncbi:4-vinyl reductase [Spartinivicinus ruber]|uniref:4-vinyl reductase n=1 Tax=Spartinivicinus ruber TaxID=2683272 RepID=UPI0013D5ECB7|nr:4-vinyl reductase [Spartinivicinus ruber]
MGYRAPEVPINVDEETGVWTTDALPMLYVPRHFFMNNHTVIEEALGADKYAEILYQAGYKSAYYWCQQEAKEHDIFGVEVFEHYMRRLSQRGWGIFSIEDIDLEKGYAKVRLDHSAFVYHYGKVNRKLEYMFTGWFAGAMDQIVERLGYSLTTQAEQLQSEAEEGCDHGLFEVKTVSQGDFTRH